MSPDKNNWQDLASDLGLSFEIDPNAPELPPEPEPVVVVEQTVITSVRIETPELVSEADLAPDTVDEAGNGAGSGLPEEGVPGETSEEARKRKRGRRRRRGRNENGVGDGEVAGADVETPELVGSAVGRNLAEFESDDDSTHLGGHGHSPHDEEEFVLEDLTNLNVPIWTELIDSLYRPER